MDGIKAVAIAFSTYSIIPMPHFDWTEKNMRYSLSAFPVVGVFLALLTYLWYSLCGIINISNLIGAAIGAAIPFIFTGCIHMDGYCDTVDALSSHAPKAKKLEILKDSHIGAFAAIRSCIYVILYFVFTYEVWITEYYPIVCVGFVISRACSTLLATILPKAKKSGMLSTYTKDLHKNFTVICMIILLLVASIITLIFNAVMGVSVIIITVIWSLIYQKKAKISFGGVTGDTAGYYLQYTELFILVAIILGKTILGVIH